LWKKNDVVVNDNGQSMIASPNYHRQEGRKKCIHLQEFNVEKMHPPPTIHGVGGLTNSSCHHLHIKLRLPYKSWKKCSKSANRITFLSSHQETFCSRISAKKEQ
jgi:hypothetical protein